MAWLEPERRERDDEREVSGLGSHEVEEIRQERDEHEGFGASRHWGGDGSDHEARGFAERLGDEIRSWFGDEDAKQRRRLDDEEAGS